MIEHSQRSDPKADRETIEDVVRRFHGDRDALALAQAALGFPSVGAGTGGGYTLNNPLQAALHPLQSFRVHYFSRTRVDQWFAQFATVAKVLAPTTRR